MTANDPAYRDGADHNAELERERQWLRERIDQAERELAETGPVSPAEMERDMEALMERLKEEVRAGRMKL